VGNGDFLHNRDPLHPVMAVHVEDAHRFARWLGGKLPSTQQWDKAAGRFEDNPLPGPYDPNWDPAKDKDRTQIALNRPQGPLPVGTASKDRSPFGCRDMAGNGFEWTRNLAAPAGQEVPSPGVNEETRVLLRGQTYQPSEDEPAGYPPFRFSALKPEPSGSYTRPQADIGFRVVLEP
jgi:formylglycine-generating enzyme required for sulfatase activity